MTNHPKSPEVIQAQLAAYAAEHNAHEPDRTFLIANAGALAVGGVPEGESVVRVSSDPEGFSDPLRGQIILPAGQERTVADRESYAKFLREKSGARNELITGRTKLLENFNEFREDLKHAEGELGRGGSSKVHRISHDGLPYAVRRMHSGNASGQIDNHMLTSIKLEHMPERYYSHVEHVQAASYEDGGTTIAPIMPGKRLDTLSVVELATIGEDQLDVLVGTIAAADKLGVKIDTSKSANYFYDPEAGFGIIDLDTDEIASSQMNPSGVPVSSRIVGVAKLLGLVGRVERSRNPQPEYYERAAQQSVATLPVLEAYQRVCARLPEDIFPAEPRQEIADLIEEVHNATDPAWLAKQDVAFLRTKSRNYDDDSAFV